MANLKQTKDSKSKSMGLHKEVLKGRTQQVFFNPEEAENYFYYGTHDVHCNLNSSEYCSFWLDPLNWSAGQWDVEIIEENGTTMYARINIQADIHVIGNPLGYQFGMDDDEEIVVEGEDSSQNWLQFVALTSGLAGVLLLVNLMNNRSSPLGREEE